jgi:hypothetical protein
MQNDKHSGGAFGWTVFAILLLACPAALWGRRIQLSDQLPIYDGIRQTASIIFGVIGAWLAIVYQDDLKSVLKDAKASVASEASGEVLRLCAALLWSSVIVCIVLLISFAVPIVKSLHASDGMVETLRSVSFAVLWLMTAGGVLLILLSLAPMDKARRFVQKAHGRREAFNMFTAFGRETDKE